MSSVLMRPGCQGHHQLSSPRFLAMQWSFPSLATVEGSTTNSKTTSIKIWQLDGVSVGNEIRPSNFYI